MLLPETYTGGIVQTNAHLLHFPNGPILVDAPSGVAAWLQSKKVQVTALLLTHQHFDHVQDAAQVKSTHGCPIYAWEPFSRDLTLETFFGAMTGSSLSVPEFQVDHVLSGESELTVGDQTWALQHIPGHSQDSLCFYLKEQKLLLSGDVIFRDSLGRTDFPGGSFQKLLSGIHEKLWPLPDDTRVFSGHSAETTIGRERRENPFL